MKFNLIQNIVDRLPKKVKKDREEAIGRSFLGTGQELRKKTEKSLYAQVRLILAATVIFLILLGLLGISYITRDRRIMITRNQRGGGEKEEQIKFRTEQGEEVYNLRVRPRGYAEREIPQAFKRAEQYVTARLKGKNSSLNQVSDNLRMPEEIPGENMAVQWESEDPTIIDESGKVFSKNVKRPVIVLIYAKITCQDQSRVLSYPVCVVPGNAKEPVFAKTKIIKKLKEIENESLEKEQFVIPKSLGGGTISLPSKESRFPAVIVIGSTVIVFLWYRESEKYRKEGARTLEDSRQEYPQIITQMTLFLGAGMSVPSALSAVAEGYRRNFEKGRQRKIFVYEEIEKTCRQISFGVSQTDAFYQMGKELELPAYQKLSVLLVQSITRGSKDLFMQLKQEEEGAFFQRKECAKRKGEEASTKLLGPMMIMLSVILALLMFPALSTFS